MNAIAVGRKAIRFADSLVNFAVLVIIAVLVAFAGYALWDSDNLHQAADKSNYVAYKPTVENEGKSFQQLQTINADVFAWLTVFGTNIDYPITQGPDNIKYVNTSAEGQYSLSGAIFLDYNNSRDFQDFNSILYGHHMVRSAMFGDIESFKDKKIFDTNKYGLLYYDGKDHGIEFFAFIHCDAYDTGVFTANVQEEYRQEYLDGIYERAIHSRDIGVTTQDHLLLLSTCSAGSTNGRDLLVGRIVDTLYTEQDIQTRISDRRSRPDPYGAVSAISVLPILLLLTLVIRLLVYIFVTYYKWNRDRKNQVRHMA
jgi:sortase B